MKQLSLTFGAKVKPIVTAVKVEPGASPAPARPKDSSPFVPGRTEPASRITQCVYCKTIHAEKKFCPMCGAEVI